LQRSRPPFVAHALSPGASETAGDRRRPDELRRPPAGIDLGGENTGMFVHKATLSAIALAAAVLVAPGTLRAQGTSALDQAVLAELNPDKRAEVQQRATGSNTVREVLETMLLNSVKLRYPANRIVALDFGRGVVIVETPENQLRMVNFDKKTLAISN
jgi:hypothetical protein